MEQYTQYCNLWISYFYNVDRKTWLFTSESNLCSPLTLQKQKLLERFYLVKERGNLATESEKFY